MALCRSKVLPVLLVLSLSVIARSLVATLGAEFLRGVSGAYRLPNFPRQGTKGIVDWQQASQNFVIIGVEQGNSGEFPSPRLAPIPSLDV